MFNRFKYNIFLATKKPSLFFWYVLRPSIVIAKQHYDLLEKSVITQKKERYFLFDRRRYKYFYHNYCLTWLNERVVEMPIALDVLKQHNPEDVLEVGNVLSHYSDSHHTIVDKYEKSKKVINQDIINFQTNRRFKLIISTSTIQHIGWDEARFRQDALKHNRPEVDKSKIVETISHLLTLLAQHGQIHISAPLGYNPVLDETIFRKELPLDKFQFMRRVTGDNLWVQCDETEVRNNHYNRPFKFANALFIGSMKH